MVESLGNVLAECVAGTTGRYTPTAPVIWVRPQQIAHGSFVRNFLNSVESPNVVEGIDAGRKTAVEAKDLVVDEGREGEVVEKVGEVLPDVGVAIFAKALVVEAVDLGDLARLVVAAKDGDPLRISDLEGYE